MDTRYSLEEARNILHDTRPMSMEALFGNFEADIDYTAVLLGNAVFLQETVGNLPDARLEHTLPAAASDMIAD